MKNLNEEEILTRLHAKRDGFKVTPEEVANPDYEVWGRAREWEYHQAVCLLAGLTPLSKPYFELLIKDCSDLELIHWIAYYPTQGMDRTRLQNLNHLLENFPQLLPAKKDGQTIQPRELVTLCKTHQSIAPSLPVKLIEVVDNFGPHLSINLPNVFSSLELNPLALINLKSIEERRKHHS